MAVPSRPRESAVEAAIVRYAKAHGWWTRKFVSPAQRGVPDRVFMKRGVVVWMEVKRPGEKPTKLQMHEMGAIAQAGGIATWADNAATGCRILDAHETPLPTCTIRAF